MKNIYKFLTNKRYFITWTICYAFALWAILYFLFKFSIFNLAQWNHLLHARLYGFAGFVFGLLILAAGPLYIATSMLIWRKNKPLIEIPLPKIIKSKPEPKPAEPAAEQNPAPEPDYTAELNEDIPLEMAPMFIRAKKYPKNFNIAPPKLNDVDTKSDIAEIPIPTDFDIEIDNFDTSDTDNTIFNDTPVFTSINFDSDNQKDSEQQNTKLTKYLDSKSIAYKIIDDIVVTDKYAIAIHGDDDFWVTDNENWFATGKSKPSPALAAKSVAEQHNVQAVLYLATENIMDIETLIPQWESDGIKIITDIEEL
jgi:hypothetical protein